MSREVISRVTRIFAAAFLTAMPVLAQNPLAAPPDGGREGFPGGGRGPYVPSGPGRTNNPFPGVDSRNRGDPYNHARNLESVFGKILRIDQHGRNSARRQLGIWWDPKDGRMFEARIDQNTDPLLDLITQKNLQQGRMPATTELV